MGLDISASKDVDSCSFEYFPVQSSNEYNKPLFIRIIACVGQKETLAQVVRYVAMVLVWASDDSQIVINTWRKGALTTERKKIIFYSSTINGSAIKLISALLSIVSDEHLHFSGDITDFSSVLLKSRQTKPIAVIQLMTIVEATEMKRFSEIFEDLFLVIVTDGNADLVAKCRKLYPRFLCQSEGDFKLLSAVIKKRFTTL